MVTRYSLPVAKARGRDRRRHRAVAASLIHSRPTAPRSRRDRSGSTSDRPDRSAAVAGTPHPCRHRHNEAWQNRHCCRTRQPSSVWRSRVDAGGSIRPTPGAGHRGSGSVRCRSRRLRPALGVDRPPAGWRPGDAGWPALRRPVLARWRIAGRHIGTDPMSGPAAFHRSAIADKAVGPLR
ncbi:hypothetical protein D3C80_1379190 [compost metagenome]